eukprot:TRINITY_DN29811_c0_g1_i1.p1 TRINITY_DN29811_c0_g1~~TRINITY_DN29811_c0_g1_i1.p1  ORF type:complete len:157 (-),score=30.48 TRINITY_DN29811_c0_g1_i1:517-918(-)
MAVLTFFPVAIWFDSKEMRLLICVLFMAVRGISSISCFTSAIICCTNSIEFPQHLGAINGISQTLMMIMEALGPPVGASLYAWSVSGGVQHFFPLDYRLYWLCWGALCVAMYLMATLLPPEIDKRKFVTVEDS